VSKRLQPVWQRQAEVLPAVIADLTVAIASVTAVQRQLHELYDEIDRRGFGRPGRSIEPDRVLERLEGMRTASVAILAHVRNRLNKEDNDRG
jgi:hypothetical protein